MPGNSPSLDPNLLRDFAQAHGFSHAREIPWTTAVSLVEKLELIRRIDMGDRDSYLGRHPQYGLIAVTVSAISHCYVFGYDDFPGLSRAHLSLI